MTDLSPTKPPPGTLVTDQEWPPPVPEPQLEQVPQ
jgi:hypothetical protein